jgi:4-hydroxybenzoyl-CoA thioesterase
MPTVSLQADFIAVSRMGEDVTFALAVDDVGTRAMSLALACRCGSEERVRARQVIVTTSLDTHEAIAIPSDLRTAIERFRHQGSAARRKSGGGP